MRATLAQIQETQNLMSLAAQQGFGVFVLAFMLCVCFYVIMTLHKKNEKLNDDLLNSYKEREKINEQLILLNHKFSTDAINRVSKQ